MDYSSFKFLDISVDDGIATARMKHPERLNACNDEDHREFARSLRAFAADDDVRAIVLTGAGKAFSIGGEHDAEGEMHAHPEKQRALVRDVKDLVYAHLELDKPVITALNGYAMGAGAAFGLLADFVIVERQVRFGDGHIGAALAAGDGGMLIWPMSVGMIRAKKYLLTGDWIDAEEAERIGLVTEVVERGESFDRAMALARRLADGPQLAIRHTKLALQQWLRHGASVAFEMSVTLEMETLNHPDFEKALTSLKSKGPGAISKEWTWRR